MGEADRSVVALNDVCCERRVEGTFRDACLRQQRLGRRSDRGCETERIASPRWEAGQAHPNKPLERRRDRQRFERVDVAVERAGDLEREERVPARLFVNPEKCLACKRSAEPVAEQPVHRADAERLELDLLQWQARLELEHPGSGDEPPGEQDADVFLPEPPESEGQSARGRRIEPLDVIDRDDDWLAIAQQVQDVPDCDSECPVVDRIIVRFFDEQRDLECVPPRGRESRQHIAENALEQISEAGVREPALGLGGPGAEHAQPPRGGLLDADDPERRLADAGLAFEHERSRASFFAFDEGPEGGELLFPADNLGAHRPCPIVPQIEKPRKQGAFLCDGIRRLGPFAPG